MANDHKRQDKALQKATYWLVKMQSPSFSKSDELQFLEWLSSSPANQQAYVKAEQTWERGGVLSEVKVLEPRKFRILDLSWLNADGWKYTALASFLCVALFFGFRDYRNPAPEFVEYKTQRGEQREIVLQDGSTMMLNTESVARVGVNRSKRLVLLDKGEAFFSVKSDSKRTFDVLTSTGSVRVLGTKFSVYNSEEDTIVTVLNGRVGLAPARVVDSDADFAVDKVLTKNQQMHIKNLNKNIEAKAVDASAHMAWRAKRIVAVDQPLSAVVSDINRYYETKIQIGDSLLASKKVSAVIALGDFDLTLTTLSTSLSLKTKKSLTDDTVLLY